MFYYFVVTQNLEDFRTLDAKTCQNVKSGLEVLDKLLYRVAITVVIGEFSYHHPIDGIWRHSPNFAHQRIDPPSSWNNIMMVHTST